MTAPDMTTEVVGYRQWYVTPDLELRSCGLRSEKWSRGDNTATCRRRTTYDPRAYEYTEPKPNPCGDCPGGDCECGFYALHAPSDLWYGKPQQGMWMVGGFQETDTLVSGIIVAWGAMQVHHQGFRSAFARIAALALPKSKRDQVVARAVASAYGVPCVPSEQLPKIAAEFGVSVPVEFRPDRPKSKPDELTSLYQWFIGSSAFGSSSLYKPSQITWSSSIYPAINLPKSSKLWTPEDDKDKTADDKLAKYRKPPANRQGPPRPQRGPKNLGPGR